MAEELFDVVDEHDNVVDTLPRSEVHRRKLRHRAVHIFLFRADGRMLIHLRTAQKVEFPSVWSSSAAGHVTSGDDYSETAERELFEELGVFSSVHRVARVAACEETCFEFTELFVASSNASLTADPEEIAEVRWMTLKEIDTEIRTVPESFSPAFRLLFETYQEQFASF